MPNKRPTYALRNISLDEVSLVDDGANPKAKAVFYKRREKMDYSASDMSDEQRRRFRDLVDKGMDEQSAYDKVMGKTKKSSEGDTDMDIEELQARLTELENTSVELTKRAETAEAALGKFEKAAMDAGFEITKSEDGSVKVAKAAEEEMIEFNGERIAKSSIPAPLLKHLNDQAEKLAAIEKQRENEEFRKRAEEAFPNLAGTASQKASLMKSIDGIQDEQDRDAVMKSLKAADAAVSKMFEEVGDASVANEASATSRLNKMAEKFAADNNVDQYTAFAEVTKTAEGKKLVIEARSEAR